MHLACSGVKVRLPDAKKCTCRRKGVILTHARSCEKVQISEVMLDFACLLLACCLLVAIFELFCAVPGCENMHIPKERSDFAYCVLRQKSTHSSENSAAKKCTFRRKGVILHLACSGEKVRFPDAKKCTCRRKGVILPTACSGGDVHIHRKIRRRKRAHSEGKV